MRARRVGAWLLLTGAFFVAPAQAEELRQPVRVAFHVHTGVSDGVWTARQVLEEAQRLGLDGVVFADTLLERWEFGLPPLRRLVRRVMEEPSVLRWGAASYLQHLEEVSRTVPQLIVLPGVTVSPFYRWTDIPLLRHGRLEGWHRQLVVLGVRDPRVLTTMPMTSSSRASWGEVVLRPARWWPVAVILAGVSLWRRAVIRRRRALFGLVVTALGGVLLLNADVRRTSPFHPYVREPGARPYQAAIDHAMAGGGLVVWSHPAMVSEGRFMGIPITTPAHTHLLLETQGYTGVGVNYWNYVEPIEPGAEWDQQLLAYCRGRRAQPVWVFGEIAWHNTDRPLNLVETIAYVRDRTPAALLEALRAGRMYAQFNIREGPDVQLERVRLVDVSSPRAAGLGETLMAEGPVTLEIAGTRRAGGAPLRLTIVRNGAVVHDVAVEEAPFTLSWRDEPPADMPQSYYRVALTRDTSAIYTNPIFVRRHVP